MDEVHKKSGGWGQGQQTLALGLSDHCGVDKDLELLALSMASFFFL